MEYLFLIVIVIKKGKRNIDNKVQKDFLQIIRTEMRFKIRTEYTSIQTTSNNKKRQRM